MKKWIVYLCCLLAGVGGGAGCSDDEEFPYENKPSWFAEIDDEHVVYELKDVPAYVYWVERDYVFINYSKYADLYYSEDRLSKEFTEEQWSDLKSCCIAVNLFDYNKYNVPIEGKIYITAFVTNNNKQNIEGLTDPGIFWDKPVKAYVKNIRIRE